MEKEKFRKILAIRDYNLKKEDEFPKNLNNITKDELHDHFDLDDDGKVTLDEYADHINFHCDNPEILDEELENAEYEKGFKYKKGGKIKKAKTWKEKYNKKYGNELNASNSLSKIAEDTGVSKKGIQQIYNKGIGAYKTNPSSVRPNVKSKEQWAQARVYSAVMGGKAAKVDKKELSMEKGGIMDSRRNKDKEFDRAQEREYIRSQYDSLTQNDKEKLKMIQQMMAKEKVNYAKGGRISKDDKAIFTKHAKYYLKQLYQVGAQVKRELLIFERELINEKLEDDYLPNLKKIGEKSYSVEYPVGAETLGNKQVLVKEEFLLTKKSLKVINTYEKDAKNGKWEKPIRFKNGKWEEYAKGGEISIKKTKEIAEEVIEQLKPPIGFRKKMKGKYTLNPNTLEEGSFDLDLDGQEYEGGSYYIKGDEVILASITPQQTIYNWKKKYAKGGEAKEYNNIAVWDLTFYRQDEEGNALKDDNGNVITYRVENYDSSYLAEGLDIDDLEEIMTYAKGGSIEERAKKYQQTNKLIDKWGFRKEYDIFSKFDAKNFVKEGKMVFALDTSNGESYEVQEIEDFDDYRKGIVFGIEKSYAKGGKTNTKISNLVTIGAIEKPLKDLEKIGKLKLEYLYNQLKISKNILDNSIGKDDRIMNSVRYDSIQKLIDNILIK